MNIYIREPNGIRIYPLITETQDPVYIQKMLDDLDSLGLTERVTITNDLLVDNLCGLEDIFKLNKVSRLIKNNPFMIFKDLTKLEYFLLTLKIEDNNDAFAPFKKTSVLLQDCTLLKSIEKYYHVQLFNL